MIIDLFNSFLFGCWKNSWDWKCPDYVNSRIRQQASKHLSASNGQTRQISISVLLSGSNMYKQRRLTQPLSIILATWSVLCFQWITSADRTFDYGPVQVSVLSRLKVCKHVNKSGIGHGKQWNLYQSFVFVGGVYQQEWITTCTCNCKIRHVSPKGTALQCELKRNPIFPWCRIFPLPKTSKYVFNVVWLTADSDLRVFSTTNDKVHVLHQVQGMKRVLP